MPKNNDEIMTPNPAANRDPAEGPRESTGGGGTNRPIAEQEARREEDADPVMPTGDSTLKTKI
jgi:hypothetical protein